MNVRLINAIDFRIMDQFSLNKNLHDTIKYLNKQYDCEIVCSNYCANCYVRYVKGV